MIKKIEIENYKSLENLSMELGRFNVLIGENGCGKTNILESLVFAAAGISGNVENNFIALRGGRPSEPKFYRGGFGDEDTSEEIKTSLIDSSENKLELYFSNDDEPFSKWFYMVNLNGYKMAPSIDSLIKGIAHKVRKGGIGESDKLLENGVPVSFVDFTNNKILNVDTLKQLTNSFQVSYYMIYAPENYFLRNRNINETHTEPVG